MTNTPEVLTETTAELGFTLMLATARRIVEAEKYVQEGQWKSWGPYLLSGKDVYGSTVGIFGMGDIGKAFVKRLKDSIQTSFIIIVRDMKMQSVIIMLHLYPLKNY